MDLDVLLAHEDSRHAMARLAVLSLPLGKLVLQYLRLFKPATRQMSHTRVVALVEELLPDLQRGAITRNGREWAAPLDTWRAAIDKMLDTRDKLTLPLKSHGYLYEIILGLADKQEAATERDTEAQRRNKAQGGSAVQPVQVMAAQVTTGPAPVPAYYAQPSRAALKIREEIEAKRKPREPAEGAE